MDNLWHECFVLHRRPYRETSFMVDLFARDLGIVRVIAKGARGKKSERKSLLQPLQPLRIQLYGKGDLKNLKHIEAPENAVLLNGQTLFCAMYVNELLTRVFPQLIPAEALYEVYFSTLKALHAEQDIEQTLRRFEFAVLEELGVMPDLSTDGHTGEFIAADGYYRLMGESGLVPVAGPLPGALHGKVLLDLINGEWNDDVTRMTKRLCRQMLAPLLGDKPLKSRELFQASKAQ